MFSMAVGMGMEMLNVPLSVTICIGFRDSRNDCSWPVGTGV